MPTGCGRSGSTPGLTARAVAVAAGWHESKCSRIEHARTPPPDDDVLAWCRVCGASDQAADLITASRAAESTWTQWRRLERPGMRRAQEAVRRCGSAPGGVRAGLLLVDAMSDDWGTIGHLAGRCVWFEVGWAARGGPLLSAPAAMRPWEEGRTSHDEGSRAASGSDQAVRVKEISRPSRRLKRRLTTQAGEISPEGEIPRPCVQAVVKSGKLRGYLCPRPESHLMYMINIALTVEFSLAVGAAS